MEVYKNTYSIKFQKNGKSESGSSAESRNGRGWNQSRGNQTLEGASQTEGATGADSSLTDIAE